MLGIVTEAGELAELVQWNSDHEGKLGNIAIFVLHMTDLHGRRAENLLPASSVGKL
jgi:NTP pyrophosphatase (non-canonical NTP hydrolase)